jgi:hypothetical protein
LAKSIATQIRKQKVKENGSSQTKSRWQSGTLKHARNRLWKILVRKEFHAAASSANPWYSWRRAASTWHLQSDGEQRHSAPDGD